MAKQRFICTLKSQAHPGEIEKLFSWAYLEKHRGPTKVVYTKKSIHYEYCKPIPSFNSQHYKKT